MNKRSYTTEAWNSPYAAHVFRYIFTGEADYTTKIAQRLNSKPQTVSNYLKGMRELGFIERAGKSGRKQRYDARLDMLVEYWYDDLLRVLEEDLEEQMLQEDVTSIEDIENHEELQSRQKVIENFKEHEEEIKNFAEDFVAKVLKDLKLGKEHSLRKVFVDEFSFSLLYIYYDYIQGKREIKKKKLEWLNALFNALIRARTTGLTINIMGEMLNTEE